MQQTVRARSFAKSITSTEAAKPNPLARPLNTTRAEPPPKTVKSSAAEAANLRQEIRTPMPSARPADAPWSLTDSSLSAEEENFWGEWKKDMNVLGETRAASVDLSQSSALHTHLVSVEELEAPPARRTPAAGNLQEIKEDAAALAETEKHRLASESFGKFPWAVELAHSEKRAERLGVVDYANGFQKHEILKMRTREFTARLASAFREQVEVFNEARKSATHAIQLYKINNTAEDFMLFRNGVKLVVSGQQAGRLLIAFNQFLGQIYNGQQSLPTVEITAVWGPFEQLVWQHKGERVQIEDIVRFFLSEFVRQSFR